MKILVWTPPWTAQGDPLFYRNTVRKHLVPQANLLASVGVEVDVVLPALLLSEASPLDARVRVLPLSFDQQLEWTGSVGDPSSELYRRTDAALERRLHDGLATLLAPRYDVILLWETPVPFFEALFPDALIVHQMPGAFSRAPFPHTVTFDPVGLYRHGALYQDAPRILAAPLSASTERLVAEFAHRTRAISTELRPIERAELDPRRAFSELTLLPLQVSGHYAFQADTGYANQTEFLFDVLRMTPSDRGLVVTQYVTPRVRDTILTEDVVAVLREKWPNVVHKPMFDQLSSVSQYLLPVVDSVVSASSSIGIQGMIWGRPLHVPRETFLAPYANERTPAGVSRDEVEKRTLGFVLGRHQPLAQAILQDAPFLLGLLEEMLARKRAGKSGVELFPDFESLDPNYAERLLSAFVPDRAARDLGKTSATWTRKNNEFAKFCRALERPEIRAVTFDVFDTLIRRPTEAPADVFKFLELTALQLSDGLTEDFARFRTMAEVETRAGSTRGEITLDEIYETLGGYYGLTPDLLERLKKAEIDYERSLVTARPSGRKFFDKALTRGVPVHLISDMYLSVEVVETMLRDAGYSDYGKLFLSSHYGVRKKEGDLFDRVVEEIGIPARFLLHVGDNRIADVEQAEKRGLTSFRIPRAIDRMRANPIYQELFPPRSGAGEKARSAIAGLLARELFETEAPKDPSHFQGSAYHLGYAGIGPLLVGYVNWLEREAVRDGVSRLYFLAREGWILKRVYDVLRHEDAPPSSYLYASRRSTRVAALKTRGDVLALASQPFKAGVALDALLESRFGLKPTALDSEVLRQFGYERQDVPLESTAPERVRLSQLCSALAPTLLVIAAEERDAYLGYLEREGFLSESRPAVVDVGWRANIQGALGLLRGAPLDGYYYALLPGAELWIARGHRAHSYSGPASSTGHPSHVLANRHLVEYLLCHQEPSLIRYRREDERLLPVFREEEGHASRRALIEEVHRGAERFAGDLARTFPSRRHDLWIDPFLAERVLASFLRRPHAEDARLLLGHSFEDALGGVRKRYLVSPKPQADPKDSVWPEGFLAVFPPPKPKAPAKPAPGKPGKPAAPAKAPARPAALARVEDNSRNRGPLLERVFVRLFASEKKFKKYERDRAAFFRDSKSALAQRWFRSTS